MAEIFHPLVAASDKSRKARINAMPTIVPLPALKTLAAAEINGGKYYYPFLDALQKYYKYFMAGGFVTDPSNIEQACDEAKNIWHDLERQFETVGVLEQKWCGDDLYEDVLVACNDFHIPDNLVFWYDYKEVAERNPGLVKQALISGLYLLSKTLYKPVTDTYDYEMMIENEDEYYQDIYENDKLAIQKLKDYQAFMKKDPIKLRWYAKAFHYHAARNTPLGDWLRCCWHYRKLDWWQFVDRDCEEQGVDLGDLCVIVWEYDDFLCNEMLNRVNDYSGNYGTAAMRDYTLISEEKLVRKAKHSREEIAKLSRDFMKLCCFSLKELKYTEPAHKYTQILNPNEYDYKRQQLRPKPAAYNLHRPGNKKGVRGRNTNRKRRATRKPAHVA